VGKRYRGVWGLFGSYDYIAPQIFRVSSTALSLGSTSQWTATSDVSLQSTGMLGLGYAAVGTANASRDGEEEYHYGVAPQALLAGRLILRDRVSFDLTAREFFVSDIPETASEGSDNIARVDAALTIRLHRQRAISLKYQWSRRDASYPEVNRRQARSTLGIFYTMLGNDRFGAVDWR
jgi:hypothetical protein